MPRLTFKCPFAEETPASPEKLCDQDGSWAVEARREPHFRDALWVDDADATCPQSLRDVEDPGRDGAHPVAVPHVGVAVDAGETVYLAGPEGLPAE